jgi:hypothetical protein
VSRCGAFVNNRHDDTGWAANVVAEALRRRLGRSSDVFIDNQSIGPGQPFAQVLEDGVRRSEVLVALIGQRWTEPPFMDRLFMADQQICTLYGTVCTKCGERSRPISLTGRTCTVCLSLGLPGT